MILRIGPFDNYFTIQVLVQKDQNNVPYNLSNSDGIFLNFSDGTNSFSSKNVGTAQDLANGTVSFFLNLKDSQKVRTFKSKRYSISARLVKVDGTVDETGIAYGEWIEYEKVAEEKYTQELEAASRDIVSLQNRIASNQNRTGENNRKADAIEKENQDLQKNLAALKLTKEKYTAELSEIQKRNVPKKTTKQIKNITVQTLG